MKKNSQLHLFLETELLDALKKQALENGISVSEHCRLKLKEISQLSKIEMMVENINKRLEKAGFLK